MPNLMPEPDQIMPLSEQAVIKLLIVDDEVVVLLLCVADLPVGDRQPASDVVIGGVAAITEPPLELES